MGECIITYNPSADKALGFNTLGELDFTDSEFKEFVRNNPLLFKEYIEKIAREKLNKKSEPVKIEPLPLDTKEVDTESVQSNNEYDVEKELRIYQKLQTINTVKELTKLYLSDKVSESSRVNYKHLFTERKDEIINQSNQKPREKISRKGDGYIDNEPDGLPSINMDTRDC